MMGTMGIKDIPIMSKGDESLGLIDYAHSLSEFIQNCETPITIAIQGDWGSGKTSMMNLIKEDIGEKSPEFLTIWFNTWQYSQFDLQDYLAVSLISYFVKELGEDTAGKIKKVLGSVLTVGKSIAFATANILGSGAGDIVKDGINELAGNSLDSALQIVELRRHLEELVRNKIKTAKKIIVFIDDLDRLIPEKAVDFLEVFKLFLEIEGCVFVLACDYSVVMHGLKQKFGIGQEDLKGKNFFDKIIQLPFNMPLGIGNRQNYISGLLDKIDARYEAEDIAAYEELVETSVGFNPRNIKRLFNSLLLLNLVAHRKNMYGRPNDIATDSEKQKVLFAILCLQIAYEPLYKLLLRDKSKITRELFDSFINFIEPSGDGLDADNKKYAYLYDLQKDLNDDRNNTVMRRLSRFMDKFLDCIQLKSCGFPDDLEEEEINNFINILSFSSITSVDVNSHSESTNYENRYLNREIMKNVIKELQASLQKQLKNFNSRLVLYQPRKSVSVSGVAVLDFDNRPIRLEIVITTEKEDRLSVNLSPENSRATKLFEDLNTLLKNDSEINSIFADDKSFVNVYERQFGESSKKEFEVKVIEELNNFMPQLFMKLEELVVLE